MKKLFFKMLVRLNNRFLPRFSGRKDIARLTKAEQLILGFRYWALKNAL